MQAELTMHLGHDRHEAVVNDSGNTRNGSSAKTLKSDYGALPIDIPRDRDSSFEPRLVAKHQTRWTGFVDKILSLYARGLTVREIQSHLEEMYVWDRDLADLDFLGHRCGHGRSQGMAGAPSGCVVPTSTY